MPEHLLENHSGIQGNILILIPPESGEHNFMFSRKVFDRWPSRTDLAA